jgi:type I site-specific restriction-modification system R (restriction) subunit
MQTETQHALAVSELTPIVADIAAFTDTIDGIDVIDEDGLGSVGDLVKMLQRRRMKLEDKRKSLVGPLNNVVKDINELFKAPREAIDLIVRAAKAKMNKYVQAQQAIEDAKRRKEREDAERERQEAQEIAANLARLSEAGNKTAEVVIEQAEKKVEAAAAPARVATTRGEASSVITQKKWKASVDDLLEICKGIAEGKLPTSFVEPNMRALQDFARELKEEQTTHGIRVYQDISTVVR